MHDFEVKGYENGQWAPTKAPEWFDRAIDTDKPWKDAFAAHRVTSVNEFDCGESISIFRAPDRSYCIAFWDSNEAILVVFIKAASDYLRFRADVIAPNVRLMRDSKELDERERARHLRRVS